MAGVIVRPRRESTTPAGAQGAELARAAAHPRAAVLLPAAILLALLAGWSLRLHMLHSWPLREDEAIYSTWARSVWGDPWFMATWPDKPPLFLWIQALALQLFGTSPAAARMVSLSASAATIPLVAWIAQRIAGPRAALLAAWLMALSPFAISFAPTAYTDSLLVFLGAFSLALALRGNLIGAGAALGAAIMTKQQGLLFAPLVFGALLIDAHFGNRRTGWMRLLAGSALVLVPILIWDALRWSSAPSPWDLGVRNYGALTLASAGDLSDRLRAWSALAWQFGASVAAWAGLLLALAAGAVFTRRQPLAPRSAWMWWLLLLWSAGFLSLHLFSTVPVWDRYLLPLAPVLAILVAVPAAALLTPGPAGWAIALGLALLLAWPAWTAARGALPIGADHGDYAGLDEAMEWISTRAVEGDVVYHRVLGWQARFALFDAVQAGDVDLRWFPSAVYLADNATKSPHRARYLIEPAWAQTRGLANALASRQLRAEPVFSQGQIGVWRIAGQTAAQCQGCVCAAPAWSKRPTGDTPAMSTAP